jgi:hypothetical protein
MKASLLATLTLAFLLPASAQDFPFPLDVPFPEIVSFDASIPTPQEVMGHEIGSRHTLPHEVVAYFKAVAAASDRVTLSEHARTYEGRPLIHAMVTAPSNHGRLEDIRVSNSRLSEDPSSITEDEIAQMPAVAYQGFSIHGNEASGTEASLLYIYYLAAAQGDWIEQALREAVLIVDPMFNPDGRDRFGDWVNRNRGRAATVDANDREHNEPWPGGRTNHYWFDLNRDWLPAQHPESQGRLSVFHAWRPQVQTDHHEMGGNSTFFFMPGVPSRNNPNTSAGTIALTDSLARFHAAALDAIGSSYYSEEQFDDFYYGKGSTFPDINGAVGILFEQASSRALKASTDYGTLTYAFTVRNQFVTAISTLKGLVAHRQHLLENHRSFYEEVSDFVRASPVKGYVVSLDRGRVLAEMLAQLMGRHDVEAYRLARDVEAGGKRFTAGQAYVLPLDQRQGRLLEAAFETTRTFEDSLFYDVSTWTLPLSHGVEYAELSSDPASLLGEAFTSDGPTPGMLIGGRAEYGYLIPWDQHYAARAAYRLLKAGAQVTISTLPFSAEVGGDLMDFERGTLVVTNVPRGRAGMGKTGPDVHALVSKSVEADFVSAYAVNSGLTPAGPDLGAASGGVLVEPRVAVLTGDGTSSYNAGEVWHLLSEHYQMPVSLLDVSEVSGADLSRYTTVVMAGGNYSGLDTDQMKDWVRSGGRLIVQDSAVPWAIRNELMTLEEKEMDTDPLLEGRPYGEISATLGAQQLGGAILELDLDQTHPLAFGLPANLPVFRQGNRMYEAPATGGRAVGVYSSEGILSGYISEEKLADLPGSAGVVVQRFGGGRVTAFMDRTYFRAFWHGSSRLMTNAIFLGAAY